MKLISPILAATTWQDETSIWHWCPGCLEMHRVPVTGPRKWGYNDNPNSPTLSPSVKHTWTGVEDEKEVSEICHYFIKEGQIEFCADSTHPLAGQTVPLPAIPEGKYEPTLSPVSPVANGDR